MGKVPLLRVIIVLVVVFTFSACAPSIEESATPTANPPTAVIEVSQANLVISSAGLEWPELTPLDPCVEVLPSPVINFCVQNQGGASASPEVAYFALPVASVPGVQANILNTLPGGSWKAAEFITIEGLPGVDGSTQGIIIINTMPEPGGSAEGIIIINGIPGADSGAQGIIIVNTMPEPGGSAEGIIIINGMPGADNISQVMGIIMEDMPGDDGSKGIIIVNTMPGPDTGAQGIIIINTMPGDDGNAQGVIIGSMPGAVGADQLGMPSGFDMEGMMAMMGEGGFGPGSHLLRRLELSTFGFPAELGPGEEGCIQVSLPPLLSALGDDNGSGFPANSFFDVFFNLTVGIPQSDDSSSLVTHVVPIPTLPYPLCTPSAQAVSLIGMACLENERMMVTFEFPEPPQGTFRATVNGLSFDCQTLPSAPQRRFCVGAILQEDTLVPVQLEDTDSGALLFDQEMSILCAQEQNGEADLPACSTLDITACSARSDCSWEIPVPGVPGACKAK